MSLLGDIMRGESTIGFVRHARRWFAASGVMVGISLLAVAVLGLNFGIDFSGGVLAQTANPADVTVAGMREAIAEVGVGEATIQQIDDGDSIRIQTDVLDTEAETAFIEAVAQAAGTSPSEVSVDAVGPTFGALVARQALVALAVFLVAVALYITWRLELKMAMVGLLALFHDLVITVGVYAITGFQVTPATVVAILTILGYSLYDTVVVFDKVEEFVDVAEKTTYGDVVEHAMNAVVARSLATSLTSLIPVGSILVVGSLVLGAPTLREFALALFVGMAAGTYSSVFLAGPLLAVWKEREEEWAEAKRRWGRRSVTSG